MHEQTALNVFSVASSVTRSQRPLRCMAKPLYHARQGVETAAARYEQRKRALFEARIIHAAAPAGSAHADD
jgi:hypothetical protein